MKDDAVYLQHITECIHRIERYTVAGREVFFGSEIHQDAVLRNLQVLSESAQRLSLSYREQHPQIDWRKVGDFRNRLVHDYLGVDLEIVWRVVEEDVPELKKAVLSSGKV